MSGRVCLIEGCGKTHAARGWCRVHYTRWRRHGDPLINNRPPHVTRHGTLNEYMNYGCRCEPCRVAASVYQKRALEPEQLDEVELRAAHQSAVDAVLVFADRLAEQALIVPASPAQLVLLASCYGDARRLVRTFRKQLEIEGGS